MPEPWERPMGELQTHRRTVDIVVAESMVVGLGVVAREAVPRPVPPGGARVRWIRLATRESAGPDNRRRLRLDRVGDPGPGADQTQADIGLELVVFGRIAQVGAAVVL